MSKLHVISAIIATTFLLNTAQANTLRFLSGEIYAAEISTNTDLIGNAASPANELEANDSYSSFNSAKALKDIDPDKKSYLVLFIKLDQNRKISIYDYTVKSEGEMYNCVSIAKDDDIFTPYDPTNDIDEWTFTKRTVYYKMLFVVEQDANAEESEYAKFTLVYNLTSPATSIKLKAKKLGSAPFSAKGSLKGGKYAPEPKPVEIPVETDFTIPTTDAELNAYISGTWINSATQEELSFSAENKDQPQGWAIIGGALTKLADSTTEGTAVTISTQNEITIAEVKYTRKGATEVASVEEATPAEEAPAE